MECSVTEEEIRLLFKCAISALEGSLLQQGSLRLLSALIQSNPFNFRVLLNDFEGSSKTFPIENAVLPSSNLQQTRPLGRNPFKIIGILGSSSSDCAQLLLQTGIPERIITKIKEYALLIDKVIFFQNFLYFLSTSQHNNRTFDILNFQHKDLTFPLSYRKREEHLIKLIAFLQ